jgi:signal transduction histidine kinase
MSDVMRHILKSTSIETEASAVHLNDVIAEVIALIQAPDINLALDLASDLPPITVDKISLHGLILNLVTNAVQAMNNTGDLRVVSALVTTSEIEGHLLVQSMSDGRPMVRLMVEDSGPGIPTDVVGRICEPFFTTRQAEGGTGLGLAICRRVIARVGGQLAVKSSPGQHTTFIVDFPVWSQEE